MCRSSSDSFLLAPENFVKYILFIFTPSAKPPITHFFPYPHISLKKTHQIQLCCPYYLGCVDRDPFLIEMGFTSSYQYCQVLESVIANPLCCNCFPSKNKYSTSTCLLFQFLLILKPLYYHSQSCASVIDPSSTSLK